MNKAIYGIHHVTAITSDPQRNIDFYANDLGLRFIKLTVNQDDPSSYHLYYGDELGRPGTILTFFHWIVLASTSGERTVPLSDYFTGYRRTVKRPDELIKTIVVPTPVAPVAAFHKIAKRRFDDISSVAIAFALTVGRRDDR